MIMRFTGLVIATILVFACKGEKGKPFTTMANPSIDFQSGILGAERFLHLPEPILSAKWCEFPRVGTPSRLAIGPSEGPTDTVLLAVLELVPGSWPKWEQAMDSASEVDMYYLDEAQATGLLPPEWLATLPQDSLGPGRRLLGDFYNPNPIAKSPWLGKAAIRHGDHLFLELGSK